MPDDLDFIFRPIPRFMAYEQAAYGRDLFDLRDVKLMNLCLDCETENQMRGYDAAKAKDK